MQPRSPVYFHGIDCKRTLTVSNGYSVTIRTASATTYQLSLQTFPLPATVSSICGGPRVRTVPATRFLMAAAPGLSCAAAMLRQRPTRASGKMRTRNKTGGPRFLSRVCRPFIAVLSLSPTAGASRLRLRESGVGTLSCHRRRPQRRTRCLSWLTPRVRSNGSKG